MTAEIGLDRLVTLAQRGDRDAFGVLVTRYKNLVFSIALGVLHDAEAARDVTQGVFLASWQKLTELRSPSSLPPWLRETARNQALFHLRSTVRERTRRQAAPVGEAPSLADDLLSANEESRALDLALDQLPVDVREVLLLFYSEEQSVAQVASLLEITSDAVKKRLQRGRETLKSEYQQQLGARIKRALPGAALVAAILGSLEGRARAAGPVAYASWALGAVAVVALGVSALAVHTRATSTVSSAVAPTRTSGGGASSNGATPPPATPPTKHVASSSAPPPVERAPADCDLAVSDILEAPPEGPLPTGDDALARIHRAQRAWLEHHDDLPDDTWVIAHCATNPIMQMLALMYGRAGHDVVPRAITDAWDDALARNPRSAMAHASASMWSRGDSKREIELLERASELEPGNPKWSSRLAQAHERSVDEAKPGTTREAVVDAKQNAIGHYERALEHEQKPMRRMMALQGASDAELEVHEDGLADQHAHEMLALLPKVDAADRNLAVNMTHDMLGRVALREGREDEAVRELDLSSEVGEHIVLRAVGPELALADELLAHGRKDAVVRYLDRAGKLWDNPCPAKWKAEIVAGRTPKLDARTCMN